MAQRYRIGPFVLSVLLLLSWLVEPAPAAEVTVGCPGASGAFDFSSIGEALGALAAMPNGGHRLTVSGECAERIFIDQFENLEIVGTPGSMIQFPDPKVEAPSVTVLISSSHRVTMRNLTIRGLNERAASLYNFLIANSSAINIDGCTIELGTAGIFLRPISSIEITATTIQDNDLGVRIDGSGQVNLSGFTAETRNVLQRNQTAILARNGAVVEVIDHNEIVSNGIALSLDESNAEIVGLAAPPNLHGNRTGVSARGGRLLIRNTRIEEQTQLGLHLHGTWARIQDSTRIRRNARGGIRAVSSQVQLSGGVTVFRNGGPGIFLSDGASITLDDTEARRNLGSGLLITQLSTATLRASARLARNEGGDLVCRSGSVASGPRSSIRSLDCPQLIGTGPP